MLLWSNFVELGMMIWGSEGALLVVFDAEADIQQ